MLCLKCGKKSEAQNTAVKIVSEKMKFCKKCKIKIKTIKLDFVRGGWDVDGRGGGRVGIDADRGPAVGRFAVLCKADSEKLKRKLNKDFNIE